jgi:PKD repeat protein
MAKGANGQPDPATRAVFVSPAAGPVDLEVGLDGALYYVDFSGSVRRVQFSSGNQAPTAIAQAAPSTGPAPLTVSFDGRSSSDPEGGTLTYAWDLDGDGAFDDSTSATPTFTYTSPATVTVGLRVTDPGGLTDTDSVVVSASNTPPVPVINTPAAGTTWEVGEQISFSGSASDAQDGTEPASRLSWQLTIRHCPSDCHSHVAESFAGVAGGSFFGPDHEYPAHLELTLTATDAQGATASTSLELHPKTVILSFATDPTGLQLGVNATTTTAPFTREVIKGSLNSLSASSPQTLGSTTYQFTGWSDGGGASHTVTANAAATYTATFTETVGGGGNYADAVTQDAPIAWYRMGEPSGAVVDQTGGTAGTALGGVTRDIPGPIGASDDGAIDFNGTSGHVSVPHQAKLSLGNGPWSIELWARRDSTGGNYRSLIDKGQNTPGLYFDIASNKFILERSNIANVVQESGSTTDSGWHHWVVTRSANGTTTRVYKDGVDVTTALGSQTFTNTTSSLLIGAFAAGGPRFFFDGAIDEVAIYNTELSPARITAHRDAASGG